VVSNGGVSCVLGEGWWCGVESGSLPPRDLLVIYSESALLICSSGANSIPSILLTKINNLSIC